MTGELELKGVAKVLEPFLGWYVRRQMQRLRLRPVKREAEARAASAGRGARPFSRDLLRLRPHKRQRLPLVRLWRLLLAGLLVLAAAGCGAGAGRGPAVRARATRPPYDVSSEVVSRKAGHDIRVWAPVGGDRWPMVYAVPGSTGHKASFDQVGPALARRGVVVLATDYREDSSDAELTRDLECGYRFARRVAEDYGADPRQPAGLVGYSRGARAVWSLLLERRFGPGGGFDRCVEGAPRPDVVVAVDGCYYGFAGQTRRFPVGRMDIADVKLVLVSGKADDVCPTWQSEKAADALETAGYDTTLVTIPRAAHDDVMSVPRLPASGAPAGTRTVKAILDALAAAR